LKDTYDEALSQAKREQDTQFKLLQD